MPKIKGHGQAEILSEKDYLTIRKSLSGWHQIFWDIACYTGERWGAICQLEVTDVYACTSTATPHEYVTFKARTRKADPSGRRKTRQVPMHPQLIEKLKAYRPPTDGWLFPSDRRPGQHICFRSADEFLRQALEKTNLSKRGISTHSTRRTLITRLDEKGTALKVIQAVTGHQDLKALSRYVEVAPERVKSAIASL